MEDTVIDVFPSRILFNYYLYFPFTEPEEMLTSPTFFLEIPQLK